MNVNNLRKGRMASSACSSCRRRKVKCSGSRPSCERCIASQTSCNYVVEEGMTPHEHLRSRISQQADEIAQLNHEVKEGITRQKRLTSHLLQQSKEIAQLRAIMMTMKNGTDEKATEILARLRLGESIEQLFRLLNGEGESS